jgi:hypothetical protein
MKHVKRFLGIEAFAFATAALVHAGVLIDGYQHRQAGIAEGVIAAVLTLGLMVSVVRPQWSRAAGLAAQGFALLGTLVGITMISIGVGPQSAFDVVLHVFFVTVLGAGLFVTARGLPPDNAHHGRSMHASRGVN